MRKAVSAVTRCVLLCALAFSARAESTWEFAVQVSASIQSVPAQITLLWPQDTTVQPSGYRVYRKGLSDTCWGQGIPLPGSAVSYVDKDVAAGVSYEYQVVKRTPKYEGYGYVFAGIDIPLTEVRGRLLLVSEDTHALALKAELERLQLDLVGDGWMVTTINVNRNDSPSHVKDLIKALYASDPEKVKAVFLFGHVPVPYSGDIVPDGHVPDHRGAWPADVFYGDMEGVWTDSSVNVSSASDSRNRNVPGDGKFDQSSLPAPLKLMVGRVDLANMPGRLTWGGPPTFGTEVELLRNYLNKNHKYRHKEFDLPRRAVLGDFFGVRDGEAFAASGWRSFAPLFGTENLQYVAKQGEWLTTAASSPALFAYGCGAGSYTSIAGLGNSNPFKDVITTELVANDIKSSFVLLFGSWLGDWDSEDNILRAVLALPSYGLASAWSGRPHWFLHHMALGQPIGYSAMITQNNGVEGLYRNQMNPCAGLVHVALMGDPTLRLHVVSPPSQVQVASSATGITLNWTAALEQVAGYNVYASSSPNGPFARRNSSLLTTTSFADRGVGAAQTYMVRAVKLETSASGTYWNLSQGAYASGAVQGDSRISSLNRISEALTSSTNVFSAPRLGTNAFQASKRLVAR